MLVKESLGAPTGAVAGVVDLVAAELWRRFHEAEAAGKLRRRVLFFTLDAAPLVRAFLEAAFGPER